MLEIVMALGPVFLLILSGFFLKRKNWVDDAFWSPAEMVTYYIFFPALLLYTTSKTDIGDLTIAPMVLSLVAATALSAAFAVKAKPLLGLNGPDFSSFFQGSIRPNSYVAIAGASALWGEPGLTLVAIAVAFIVPLVNFLSVIVMETYGAKEYHRDEGPRLISLLRSFARNPLIMACVLGISINQTGLSLPPIIDPLMEILGRAALPVGLLCVGAGLHLSVLRDAGKTVFAAGINKLLILPLACLMCCMALDVEGITRGICIFYAGLPVSASSYVLARQMGGNAPAMAGIITLTTLGAMITLPVIIFLLNWL